MTSGTALKPHAEGTEERARLPRPPLPPEIVELIALRLRVIADPTRIALLEALNDGDAPGCDLAERIGLSPQIASHHLLVLHQAGILSRRREGKLAIFEISDWSAWWVVEQLARSAESYHSDASGPELHS